MAEPKRYLSDVQWAKIEPLLPSEWPGRRGGRPRARNRGVLEAILWSCGLVRRGVICRRGIPAHPLAGEG